MPKSNVRKKHVTESREKKLTGVNQYSLQLNGYIITNALLLT